MSDLIEAFQRWWWWLNFNRRRRAWMDRIHNYEGVVYYRFTDEEVFHQKIEKKIQVMGSILHQMDLISLLSLDEKHASS